MRVYTEIGKKVWLFAKLQPSMSLPNSGQGLAGPKETKYIAVLYGPSGLQKCNFY